MTRIPVRQDLKYQEGDLEKGLVYFPLIGLLLGACSSFCFFVLNQLFPKGFAVTGAVLTSLFLTGAFHLDGLCDTVDGIYSARTPERMLEIMKDSRIGTNGTAALIADLALKWMGIYYAAQPVLLILLMPIAGKMVQGIMGYRAVYPRKEGLGLYVGTVTRNRTFGCFFLGMLFLCIGYGIASISSPAGKSQIYWNWLLRFQFNLLVTGILQGIFVSVCLFIFAVWFRKYIEKKIGGITGDVMGGASELCEIVLAMLWNLTC